MFDCRDEAPIIGVPIGDELAIAPNLLTDIASRHPSGLRQTGIAVAASVAIHGLLVISLYLVSAYGLPGRPRETRKPPIVTMLVSPSVGILASYTQDSRAGAQLQAVTAANQQLPEPVQTRPAKIQVGVFDDSFRDTIPIPANAGSRDVVVGKFDGGGGNSDGPAVPVVIVGPVGALDSFGPVANHPGSLVGPQLLTVPTPVYSEEAKRLNVTGQVVLVVKIAASGSIRYIRIVSGLGHGLDQAAIAAVNQGRCQPATRAGIPVDTYGTITVTFKLS